MWYKEGHGPIQQHTVMVFLSSSLSSQTIEVLTSTGAKYVVSFRTHASHASRSRGTAVLPRDKCCCILKLRPFVFEDPYGCTFLHAQLHLPVQLHLPEQRCHGYILQSSREARSALLYTLPTEHVCCDCISRRLAKKNGLSPELWHCLARNLCDHFLSMETHSPLT